MRNARNTINQAQSCASSCPTELPRNPISTGTGARASPGFSPGRGAFCSTRASGRPFEPDRPSHPVTMETPISPEDARYSWQDILLLLCQVWGPGESYRGQRSPGVPHSHALATSPGGHRGRLPPLCHPHPEGLAWVPCLSQSLSLPLPL